MRFEFGLLHHHPRLLLRFGDCLVGRALREQERAMEDVFGLATAVGFELHGVQPFASAR